MSLPSLALKYPVTVTMFFVGITILGIVSLSKLPVELLPDIYNPRIVIITHLEGYSPEEIEEILTEKVENALQTIKNVRCVRSTTRRDYSLVTVDFHWGTDLDFSQLEIQKVVYNIMPPQAEQPLILQYNPKLLPLIFLSISGKKDFAFIENITLHTIKKQLERIKGVAQIDIVGRHQKCISINLKSTMLEAYGIEPQAVSNAVRNVSSIYASGWVEEKEKIYQLSILPQIENLDEIGNIIVARIGKEETPLFLKDIAEINEDLKAESIFRVNGESAIGVLIYKEYGANSLIVAKRIKEELEKIKPDTKETIDIKMISDQAELVDRSINEVKMTAIVGIILAIIMIFIFLRNVSTTVIIALSIPLSILATLMLMYFFDISLNIISLGGLALGAGMLVDNSIVVLENIFRHWQKGCSLKEAAIKGSAEVRNAITASTLTTVVVFIPILYISGIAAEFFKDAALTVTFSLLCSLLVALLLIPMLSYKWLKHLKTAPKMPTEKYKGYLDWCLRNKKLILSISLLLLLISLLLWPEIKKEFMPKSFQEEFILRIKLPPGTALDYTDDIAFAIEKTVLSMKQHIKLMASQVGKSSGNLALISTSQQASNEAEILIKAKSKASMQLAEEALLERLNNIPDLKYEIDYQESPFLNMLGLDVPISMFIKGFDFDELRRLTDAINEKIRKIEGISRLDIEHYEALPEVVITFDSLKIAHLGLSSSKINGILRYYFAEEPLSRLQIKESPIETVISINKGENYAFADIGNLKISLGDGKYIFLKDIAAIEKRRGLSEIKRYENQRVSIINVYPEPGKFSEVSNKIQQIITNTHKPLGYNFLLGGEYQQMEESFSQLKFALPLAILLIFMVLASLFESLRLPFIILFSLPLASIGVFIPFFLLGKALNVMAYIGIIMLAGIVANNAIVLVDYIHRLQKTGLAAKVSIIEGSAARLRAILMTTLTTIFALFPLALGIGEGAELRSPLAFAVIGGLSVSAFLTLFIIPIIYDLLKKHKV